MGTQFAIIYDLVIVAILAGMTFAGAKKGFAGVVVGLVSVIVAFACAMAFSEPIAKALYENVVSEPLSEAVGEQLDNQMSSAFAQGLDNIDYDKVLVSGVPAGEARINYAGTGKAVMELTDLDLSGTGIENAELSVFNVAKDTDFSSVSGKTAEFTMSDIEKHGLGKLAVAQYLAVSAQSSDFITGFTRFADIVGETLPMVFGNKANEITSGSVTALRGVILTMMDMKSSAKDAVMEGIVRPGFIVAAQTIAFALIFIVVSAVLGIIASALKCVNKIPVLGKANAFVGGVAGLCEGLVAVFAVCIAVRFLVSLGGGDILFFNERAINSTYLFGIFYNFDFLNFLT